MRFRSTGLGKTELQAELEGLEPVDGFLIIHVKTTSPVRWHIRAGIQRRDLFKLARLVFTFKVIRYFLRSLMTGNTKEPENF